MSTLDTSATEVSARPAGAASTSRKAPPRPTKQQVRRKLPVAAWALLAPTIITLIVMLVYPVGLMILRSFQDYGKPQVIGGFPAKWRGFENYVSVLSDPTFWAVVGRSFGLAGTLIITTMGLGILIAILMTRLNTFFRMLVSIGLLLAWSMPFISATIIWGWIVDTQYGVLNHLLNWFTGGTSFTGHNWLIEPLSFFAVLVVIITWQSTPFVAFVVYAALMQVPNDVLEAAEIDGASRFQRFRLVVLPYLRSILVLTTILQLIWDLRVFAQVYTLQGIGGIASQTDVFGTYIYRIGNNNLGPTGAVSVIMVVLMLAVSFYYVRQTVESEEI